MQCSRTTMRRCLSIFTATFSSSFAADVTGTNLVVPPPNDAGKLLTLARDARVAGQHDNSDFYLARYLGRAVIGHRDFTYSKGLRELLKHPSWPRPTSMISGLYDDSFLEYYADASFAMWAIAQPATYDLQGRRILLRQAIDNNHYAVVWGQPTFRT